MTMGRIPGELLIGTLDHRTEEISGDFKSKKIPNTLWVYTTMGEEDRGPTDMTDGDVKYKFVS